MRFNWISTLVLAFAFAVPLLAEEEQHKQMADEPVVLQADEQARRQAEANARQIRKFSQEMNNCLMERPDRTPEPLTYARPAN